MCERRAASLIKMSAFQYSIWRLVTYITEVYPETFLFIMVTIYTLSSISNGPENSGIVLRVSDNGGDTDWIQVKTPCCKSYKVLKWVAWKSFAISILGGLKDLVG